MEKNIQIFTDERFGEVRTAKLNGIILFAGADVAQSLGYTNPRKAIRDHVDEEDRTYLQLSDFQGWNESFPPHQQGANLLAINESGVYTLIFRSKKKEAQQFRRWITNEVIPAIRRRGKYSVKGAEDNTNSERIDKLEQMMVEMVTITKQLVVLSKNKTEQNHTPKPTPYAFVKRESIATPYTKEGVIELVAKAVKVVGTQVAVTNYLRISESVISDLKNSRADRPSKTMLNYLGKYCEKIIEEGKLPSVSPVKPKGIRRNNRIEQMAILTDICKIKDDNLRLNLLSRMTKNGIV